VTRDALVEVVDGRSVIALVTPDATGTTLMVYDA
jgi:hypothetical protein